MIHSPVLVFLAGGVLCIIAQLLIDLTKLTPARILVLFVSVGVLVYATGLYEPLFELFGAGVSVPLIGFGATIARGVKEAVDKVGPLGILSGGLSASAVGITTSLILGLIISALVKSKPKRM
jgi:stage V sporulation protein AE